MNILLVSSMPPWPTDRGGNQRTFHLYQALSKVGAVDLVLLYPKSRFSDPDMAVLKERFNTIAIFDPPTRADFFPWNLIVKFNKNFGNRLAHNIGSHKPMYQPDSRIFDQLQSLIKQKDYELYVGRYLKPIAQSGVINQQRVIIDVDDLDTQKYESRLPAAKSVLVKLMLRSHIYRLKNIVPETLGKATHLWVTNNNDQEAVFSSSNVETSVLPNIPFHNGDPIAQSKPFGKNILLVCSMQMSFNERATEQFVKEIWPMIVDAEPDATLTIVGSRMSNEQIERWKKANGVDPKGTVPDLTEYYAKSAFTVTPIFDGGGTKIKVSESLMYGRTCVVAEHAQRGYEKILKHGESLLVARNQKEFANQCIDLLKDPELQDTLATNGQALVRQHFSSASFDRLVAETIDGIMPNRQA